MSSTADTYLKALLGLSGTALLAGARRNLVQSMSDKDLAEMVAHGMSREFARGGLEEIASLMLDVIARDPGSNGVSGISAAVVKDEGALRRSEPAQGKVAT